MTLSPNHGDRRGQGVELVVIHYTAMSDCAGAKARLCDPEAEVSAHYLIGVDGTVHPLVPEDRRAWHAGAGEWQGRGDVNSRSIGIELDNPGDRPFSAPMMAALERLLTDLLARYDLGPEAVIGHSDMAPGRKIDPGPRFDWRRLALQGLAIWPDCNNHGADVPLGPSLCRIGYGGAGADDLLRAFRLRFRPWAMGPETVEDRRAAHALAQRFGADTAGRDG